MDIILGDNIGHQVRISQDEWRKVIQKATLMKLGKDYSPGECMISERMMIDTIDAYDSTVIKIMCDDAYITVTRETFQNLTSLDLCIQVVFSELSRKLETIDAKHQHFLNLSYTSPMSSDLFQIITNSGYFDFSKLTDCELLMYFIKKLKK